jgi:NTE family protein
MPTMKRAIILCVALVLSWSLLPAWAQDAAPADAVPSVGLVLAGGGARGLAHVGVIKYLEEHNIRISAVAGTSMGSVVGGLYASGLNADQIIEIVQNLDWKAAFDDSTPREQLSFRRKQDDYDFLVNGKLRFKGGKLRLPLGIVQGQHLNLLLHDLVSHVSDVHDFDELPIPYRAVAADIATGDPVILSGGDLATAMRASMSIPGFFAPVDLDGKLLVDGGIAKNIPVDVVQAMGVDRLIVIDIGTPLAGRESMENVLSLMGQLTTILTRKNSEQQLALMGPQDFLLVPELDAAGVETMAFEKAELAIRLGYEAAAAIGQQLAALSTPQTQTPAQPTGIARREPPVIDRIELVSDSKMSPELLRNKVTQPLGAPFDRSRLENDIADIYGLDDFSRVDYQLGQVDGQEVLTVRATANPAGDKYLKLGMSWDQDSKGDSAFGVRGSWRQKGLNRLGGEWYTVAQLGGRSFFSTEYYQPLDNVQRFFFDANYQFDVRKINLSNDGNVLARTEVTSHLVELSPGMNFGNLAALRVGAFAQDSNADIEIGDPSLASEASRDSGYFAELKVDTLDRPYFPGSGLRLNSRYQVGDENWGADTGYDSWTTSGYAAWSFGEHTVTGLASWRRLDLDEPGPIAAVPAQLFTLGGFLALSGYTRDSLAGNYAGLGALMYYRRLNEQSLLPVDFPIYLGGSLEAGNTWLDNDDVSIDDMIYAGSLFLGVDSPLGPVYLGVGVGEDGQRAVYLQIGQLFD